MTDTGIKNELSECTIELPSVVDITGAETLYRDLTHASHAQKLVIHADKVERITTPAIQLLLAADKSLAAADGMLVVTAPSDVFKNALTDLGLDSQLKKWSGA